MRSKTRQTTSVLLALCLVHVACRDRSQSPSAEDPGQAPPPQAGPAPASAPASAPAVPVDPAVLHREALLIDTHVDISYLIDKKKIDIGKRRQEGQFDLVRAREGGLDASFFVVFLKSELNAKGTHPDAKGGAHKEALRLIDVVKKQVAANADQVELVDSPETLLAAVERGKHAAVLALENGSPIEGDFDKLRQLHKLGVRYVTLCHSKDNHISDANFDERHSHKGLTPFGRKLIAEMNHLGMLIDISHSSDDAVRQVLELSRLPVVATHSSLRVFRDIERNISDDLMKALKDNGGVVQLTFGSWFMDPDVAKEIEALYDELEAMKEAGKPEAEIEARTKELRAAFAPKNVTIDDVVKQIDYAVKLIGEDHVGIGSDFEGVRDTPAGLEDASTYPRLTAALLKRGYTAEQIGKIYGGNLMRVWRANIEGAKAVPK